MKERFEANRSSWSLLVDREELNDVAMLARSRHHETLTNGGLWMTSTGAWRTWIIGDEHESLWLRTPGRPGDPRSTLFLPIDLVDSLQDVLNQQSEDEATIFHDERADVAVGAVNGRYTTVDVRPFRPLPDACVPPRSSDPRTPPAWAEFSDRDFISLMTLPNRQPPGAVEISDWHPHLEIEFGDNQVVATVDWRRFGYGRVTRAFPVPAGGHRTVSVAPGDLWNLFMMWQESSELVRVFLDERDPDYLCMSDGRLGIRLPVMEDHVRRNIDSLCDALADIADAVPARRGARVHPVLFERGGRTHRVEILVIDGTGHDMFAVSTELAGPVPDSPAVFAEVNRLNDLLAGPTLTLEGDSVCGTVVVPASEAPRIGVAVRLLDDARRACTELSAMLPLFSE